MTVIANKGDQVRYARGREQLLHAFQRFAANHPSFDQNLRLEVDAVLLEMEQSRGDGHRQERDSPYCRFLNLLNNRNVTADCLLWLFASEVYPFAGQGPLPLELSEAPNGGLIARILSQENQAGVEPLDCISWRNSGFGDLGPRHEWPPLSGQGEMFGLEEAIAVEFSYPRPPSPMEKFFDFMESAQIDEFVEADIL